VTIDLYRGTSVGWVNMATGAVLEATGGGGGGGGTPSTDIKPRFAGLDVTDPNKISSYNGVVTAALCKSLSWGDIETSQGTYAWSKLDAILDGLPNGAYIKVVCDGGNHAPGWVKDYTGTVPVFLNRAGSLGYCAHFWESWYIDRYNEFQTAMAARYDDDERIRAVVAAGVMTENSEPFTLGGVDQSGIDLYNAGLNYTNHKAALDSTLTHMLDVWRRTRVEIALHGAWQTATASGIDRRPWSDIENFVDPFVQQYGTKLITANYGLGPNDGVGDGDPMYVYMAARGADSGYQLTVGDPYTDDTRCTAVVNGIDMGGSFIEHAAFSDGTDLDTGTFWTLEELDTALKRNAGVIA
jgi:hypothetical protein